MMLAFTNSALLVRWNGQRDNPHSGKGLRMIPHFDLPIRYMVTPTLPA